jgi:predicted MFS family arabinose efflux permease
MIPATLLITKLPAHRVVPTSMTLWALFTLLSYRAASFSELAGYRFLVGFFEGNDATLSVIPLANNMQAHFSAQCTTY